MKKGESKLQRKIRRALEKEVGGFWFKVHGGPFQQVGLPDLLGCVQGLYITVEVKFLKGITSPVQDAIRHIIRRHQGCSIVAYSPEQAVRRVKKHLVKNGKDPKNKTVPIPEESYEEIVALTGRRLIRGDGNRKNPYGLKDRRKVVPKPLSSTRLGNPAKNRRRRVAASNQETLRN